VGAGKRDLVRRAAHRGANIDWPHLSKFARSGSGPSGSPTQPHGIALMPHCERRLLSIGDQQAYSKFSALGLTITAKDYERRFGFACYRARAPKPLRTIDGIDIIKAVAGIGLADREQLVTAIRDTTRRRDKRTNSIFLSRRGIATIGSALARQATR
jgi:hypothetical protein